MNGYERLKQLYLKDYQNKSVISIVKFLLSQKDMGEKYLNDEKSISQMNEYISKKAKDYAINNVAIIEDDKVYNWALEYFNNSNEELGLNKPKNIIPKYHQKDNKEEDNSVKQLTLDF